MTPFKKNITKSIDNLNTNEERTDKLKELFDLVYSDDTADKIDDMLVNNVDSKSGSNVSINNSVSGGKFEWEIQGNCEQDTFSGRNLLPINQIETQTINGLTITNLDDGTIKINNTTNATTRINISYSQVLKANTTYVFSNANTRDTGANINLYDENSNLVTQLILNQTTSTYTPTSDVTIAVMRLYIDSGQSFDNYILKAQLEQGTSATSYEPYVGGIPAPNPSYPQDIRVVTGDNDVVVQNANLFSSEMEYGTIDNSTGQPGTASQTQIRTKNYIKVIPNTQYTISNNNNYMQYTYEYDENYNFIKYTSINTKPPFTITLSATTEYIKVRTYASDNESDLTTKFMLNFGSTALPYIPHAEQKITLHLDTNYLAGIGDYKDEIVGKTDDWKIVRKQVKIIADGVNVKAINVSINTGLYYATLQTSNFVGNNKDVILSTHFIAGNLADYGLGVFYIISNGTGLVFVPTDQTLNTKENVDTWLQSQVTANTPVTFYCATNTPTEETITDTTLISDLNDLYDVTGYAGQTNISIIPDTGNAQGTLKVTGFVTEKEV